MLVETAMTDRITANLPSKDLDETERFYAHLGFATSFRDDAWMVMVRGPLEVEFFPHRELDPQTSWFSACVRVADVDALYSQWSAVGLPKGGIPRLTPPNDEPGGMRQACLVDCNGSLLRILAPAGGS